MMAISGSRRAALLLIGSTVIVAACASGNGGTTTGAASGSPCQGYDRSGYFIEGTIDNPAGIAIPDGTGVYTMWLVVTRDPETAYVYGSGCVDREAARYVISFPSAPPASALNSVNACSFGVGLVALLTGDVPEGSDMSSIEADPARFRGGTDRFGVIFTEGDCTGLGENLPWPADFESGYGLGVCEANPGGFDRFSPVVAGTDAVLHAVDSLDELNWCNWT